jgi:hypothetical protein
MFHKDWFSHSKVNRRDIHTHTHTHRQQGNLIGLLLFFQNKGRQAKKAEKTKAKQL